MQVDYGSILRRAWDITWRNKSLWWLGLFAGGASAPNFNWNTGFNDLTSRSSGSATWPGGLGSYPWSSTFSQWLPLIVAVAGLVLLLVLVSIVLSVAAQGGLVSQANEAADGRKALASRGWGDGFRRWWRLAGIYAVLSLPFILVGLIAFGVSLFVLIIPLASGNGIQPGQILAFVGTLGLMALVLLPIGIVLGVLQVLAVRYAMIENRTWSDSLGAGWTAIKSRFKDVALMWLLMVAVSIGYGFAVIIPVLLFAVPVVALALSRLWIPLGFVVFLMVVALWVVAAAFNTFHSSAWTVFWRQMTGREPGKQPAWYGAPAGWQQPPAYYPPQPGYPPPSYPPAPAPQYPPYPPAAPPPAPQATPPTAPPREIAPPAAGAPGPEAPPESTTGPTPPESGA